MFSDYIKERVKQHVLLHKPIKMNTVRFVHHETKEIVMDIEFSTKKKVEQIVGEYLPITGVFVCPFCGHYVMDD